MKKALVSVILVAALMMSACTTSNLVIALNAVSDASSVAVVVTSSLVALGKVSPDVATQVSAYAQGVSAAVTTADAELTSSDTNAVKIAKITAAFAQVAVPAFGANSPTVSAAITAVSAAINVFLNQLNSNGVLTLAKAAPKASPALAMSHGDKEMLKKMMKKVAETKVAAAKLAPVKK